MNNKSIVTNYLKAVTKAATAGDAREEIFYPCLKDLFEAYAKQKGINNIHVTINPKKTEADNPDFRTWNGKNKIFGYAEAKHLAAKNLEVIQTTEQIQRYLTTFTNLLLTNFVEFFLFRNGEQVDRVSIAEPGLILKLGTEPPVKNEKEFFDLLDKYFSFSLPKSFTAESLDKELARRTRFLRDIVSSELEEENRSGHGGLLGFYEAFHTYLIGRITHEEFSDLYAQTVTYGLFAARTRAKDEFSRASAFSFIPKTLGILKDIFQFISLGSLPVQLEWIVDDIAEVLSVANANELLEKYY